MTFSGCIPGLTSAGGWDVPDRLNMSAQCLDGDPDALAIIDLTGAERHDVTRGALAILADALARRLLAAAGLPVATVHPSDGAALRRLVERPADAGSLVIKPNSDTGAGAGMAIGGAIPLAIGIGWLGNYGSKTGQGLPAEDYAGFLDGGAVMVGIGGVLEGVGIALIASGAAKPAVASRPRIAPTLAASPGKDGRWSLGLTGRW